MQYVLEESYSAHVKILYLNRPEFLNALNLQLRKELADAFDRLNKDDSTKCIIITGNEKSFAAGADLKEFADASSVDILAKKLHTLWRPIWDCPKPIIAAVNGFALGGGCELAMCADIIIAGESAKFGQPEIKVGIMPGSGGTQRLVRTIGKYKTMRFLLTGDFFDARSAYNMGLVSEVVPDSKVLQTALELADKITSLPTIAISQIKEVINKGADIPLETALALERQAFYVTFSTKDQKEGMKAFLEKRKPNFKGE
ncbi:MAG: enoyl-CoA hydratase-related protein [Nitrososphaeria archaeon]